LKHCLVTLSFFLSFPRYSWVSCTDQHLSHYSNPFPGSVGELLSTSAIFFVLSQVQLGKLYLSSTSHIFLILSQEQLGHCQAPLSSFPSFPMHSWGSCTVKHLSPLRHSRVSCGDQHLFNPPHPFLVTGEEETFEINCAFHGF
jgi:hypothetical protein